MPHADQFGRILHELNHILERLQHMSQQIDTLSSKVDKMTSAVDSAKTVLATLAQDLKDALAHAQSNDGDLSKIEELATKLDAKADELASAVAANTPADPNAPSAPPVAPTAPGA